MQARHLSGLSIRFALLGALGVASACGGGTTGETLYRQPLADGNSFACATCHALHEPAADGFVHPGHPIGNATRRPSYKNGKFTDIRRAVNTCLTEWMNAEPLSENDSRWHNLYSFLDAQAEVEHEDPIEIQIAAPPDDLSGGDPSAGRTFFNGACAICHGQDAAGTVRAPPLVGKILDPGYIAARVRTSGLETSDTYSGLTGGIMPFWGADRLSDGSLRDVVAFVHENSVASVSDGGPPDDSYADAGVGRSCDSTDPRVGQTAELVTRFHNVMGTATIVDDCTITVDNFHYDGTGIDVRFYGGLGGDYANGFAISDDLVKSGGYGGVTMRLNLPPDRTLDDLDGLSVWCVDVGVSFGDGMFQ